MRLPEFVTNDLDIFKEMRTLKLSKKVDSVNGYHGLDIPIAVACSEHHYYILHKECLTIISLITESVVSFFDDVH